MLKFGILRYLQFLSVLLLKNFKGEEDVIPIYSQIES